MTSLSIAKLIALLSSFSAPVSPEPLATAVEEAELAMSEADVLESDEINEHRVAAHARRDARKAARLERAKTDRSRGLGRRAPVRPEPGVRNGRNLEAHALRAAAAERLEARRASRAEGIERRGDRRNARAESAMSHALERRGTMSPRSERSSMRGRGMR